MFLRWVKSVQSSFKFYQVANAYVFLIRDLYPFTLIAACIQ